MRNIKVWFTLFTLLTIAWFSSIGCVTKQVWTDKTRAEPYQERIISFYSNQEKEEILFIGEQYHYIFNKGTKDFMPLLSAKELLNLSDKNINIYASLARQDNRKANAHVMIHMKKSELNSQQITWLEEHNFSLIQADPYYGTEHIYHPNEQVTSVAIYTKEYHLEGTRYRANKEVNQQVVKLKKPLEIEVIEFYKSNEKSTFYKVAMTPLSVTADAGLIVLGTGAAIIYAPFALTYMAYEKIKGK